MRYLLPFLIACSAFCADPVSSDRLISGGTWEGKVGVEGGITFRTTIYTNFTTNATAAQINSAITSCPSNQVVLLTNGTFGSLAGNIELDKNGVTLRGATNSSGAPITILKNSTIYLGENSGWDFGSSMNWTTTTTVSSGATRGSSTMTFASVSGLSVGSLVWVHASANANVTGSNWSDLFGTYPVSQVMKVTAINGSDVTFELPFNPDYWTGTIRAAWHSGVTRRLGIENVSLTPTDSSAGYGGHYISTQGTENSWIYNVKTYDIAAQNAHHVYVYGSYRLEIRGCDMSRMRTAEGAGDSSNNYCVLLAHSGNWLIIDNYFHRVPNVMPIFNSGSGAFAYNYIYDLPYGNNSPGWLSQIVFCHGSHLHYMLMEGNYVGGSYNEEGTSGSRNTVWLRNRMVGWDPNPTQGTEKDANTVAIVVASGHNHMVLAGNVMGENGYHTGYLLADTVAGGGSDTFPNDRIIHAHTGTTNTLARYANHNTVDDAIPSAEVLGGGDAIVTSYLFSSKPAWFGFLPWPWVDSANYTQSIQATNFPAGYRAINGTNPPASALDTDPILRIHIHPGVAVGGKVIFGTIP